MKLDTPCAAECGHCRTPFWTRDTRKRYCSSACCIKAQTAKRLNRIKTDPKFRAFVNSTARAMYSARKTPNRRSSARCADCKAKITLLLGSGRKRKLCQRCRKQRVLKRNAANAMAHPEWIRRSQERYRRTHEETIRARRRAAYIPKPRRPRKRPPCIDCGARLKPWAKRGKLPKRCDSCRLRVAADYSRRYAALHPSRAKAWAQANKSKLRTIRREWSRRNSDRLKLLRRRHRRRRPDLAHRKDMAVYYGVSVKDPVLDVLIELRDLVNRARERLPRYDSGPIIKY